MVIAERGHFKGPLFGFPQIPIYLKNILYIWVGKKKAKFHQHMGRFVNIQLDHTQIRPTLTDSLSYFLKFGVRAELGGGRRTAGEQESAGSAGLREGRARLPQELAGGRSGSEFVNSGGQTGLAGGVARRLPGACFAVRGPLSARFSTFWGVGAGICRFLGFALVWARNSKFAIISTFGVIFLLSGALSGGPDWRFFGVNSSNFDVELVIFWSSLRHFFS